MLVNFSLLLHLPQLEQDMDAAKMAELGGDLDLLASFYATKGGVDLGTLSELTRSVQEEVSTDKDSDMMRSKRTCVRVREEISKLQEILKDPSEGKFPTAGKQRGRGRGRGFGAEGRAPQDMGTPVKKYRRPAYRSQFTHKRRKKRRRQMEEGECMDARLYTCTCDIYAWNLQIPSN